MGIERSGGGGRGEERNNESRKSKRRQRRSSPVQRLYDTCNEVFADCGPGIVPSPDKVQKLASFLGIQSFNHFASFILLYTFYITKGEILHIVFNFIQCIYQDRGLFDTNHRTRVMIIINYTCVYVCDMCRSKLPGEVHRV